MFENGAGDSPIDVPVPAWLIRHGDDLALFDCGMHADLTTSAEARAIVELFFGLGLTAENLVSTQLEAHDVDPEAVGTVILSHLHFDHVGGLAQLPNAKVIVQGNEWAAGFDPDLTAANAFNPADFDLGHDVIQIEGEHDVFGDGRVTCIPTPGHTPGHQSLRVRLANREIVLCADCAYFAETLDGGALPALGHDHEQQRKSLELLRSLRSGGATLIPGHDPTVIAGLPATMS